MANQKMTIEKLAVCINNLTSKVDEIVVRMADKNYLKNELKSFATKDDLKNELKKFATKNDLESEIGELALMTQKSFNTIDFKFDIANNRIDETNHRLNRLETKIDRVNNKVVKNGDAFSRLKNYVDAEIAAVHHHLIRVDEKIGLA